MRRVTTETELEFDAIDFITQFIFHPGKTGAVAPSSGKLADLVVEKSELQSASSVIEFGSGTGVITEKVLQAMPKGATFFALEINPAFVEATKSRCPDALVYHCSATKAKKHLQLHGFEGCDRIISSLPWSTFSEQLQDDLIETIYDVLYRGGKLINYAYLHARFFPRARRFRKKLNDKFGNVHTTGIVWRNVPPAFVYCAEKV